MVVKVKKFLPFILVLITLAALSSAGYFYYQYSQNQQELLKLKNPKLASDEVREIAAKVGKLMELPKDEEPTLATVTDLEKLKDQPFFQNAQNGDKVLIFNSAQKAILYRMQSNKIINVAPLNTGSPSAEIKPIGIVIRNGTSSTGLTSKFEPEIKKVLPDAKILDKENAANTGYTQSIIIVLNESVKKEAEVLAKGLNLSLQGLPAGEKAPSSADILIILGKDRT